MPGRDTVHFKERGCLSTQVLRGQLGQASVWSKRGKESSWNIPMTGHGQEHLWGKQEHRRHQERNLFSRQEHQHSEEFKDKVRNIWVF